MNNESVWATPLCVSWLERRTQVMLGKRNFNWIFGEGWFSPGNTPYALGQPYFESLLRLGSAAALFVWPKVALDFKSLVAALVVQHV